MPYGEAVLIICNMSLSSDLFRLQNIDTLRDQANARLREIEQILKSDQALIQAQEAASKAENDLAAARNNLHGAENAVQDQMIKIEQNQSSLYGGRVRNPKELQDLQNEAAALKRHLSAIEDQQLEAMIALEEAEKQREQKQQGLQSAEAKAIEKQASLIGERDRILRDLSQAEIERATLLPSISSENVAAYERLRQQKRGIAVAKATDQTCSICGAMLTPKEWQQARSPHQLFFCPSCGRILYAG